MINDATKKLIELIVDTFSRANELSAESDEKSRWETIERYAYRKFPSSRDSFLGRFDNFFIFSCFEPKRMSEGGEILIQPFLGKIPTPQRLLVITDVDEPEKIEILIENSKSTRGIPRDETPEPGSSKEREVTEFLLDIAMEKGKLILMNTKQVENNFERSYLSEIGPDFPDEPHLG